MPTQHYRPESYLACNSVGYLLKRAHLLMVARLEPLLAGSQLTYTQWVALMHLRDGMAINATLLCAQLRHDSGALTRVIDQLEARDLVKRERSRRDRRSVQLQLTEAGHALVESLIPAVVEHLNTVLSDFSRAELAELTRLLVKLNTTMDGLTDGRPAATAEPA